jgi:hypothetical protein
MPILILLLLLAWPSPAQADPIEGLVFALALLAAFVVGVVVLYTVLALIPLTLLKRRFKLTRGSRVWLALLCFLWNAACVASGAVLLSGPCEEGPYGWALVLVGPAVYWGLVFMVLRWRHPRHAPAPTTGAPPP